MDNLYYQPDFSEFHPGFEYERNDLKGEFINWYKKTCVGWDYNEIQIMLSNPDSELSNLNNRIRVKYLDENDLIEVGLTKKQDYYISKSGLIFTFKDNILKIGRGDSLELNIKNKNELKKLMKQLNIL